MKKRIVYLVYRHLTHADFKNINKKGGEEPGGGGQSYIDLPVKYISQLNMIDVFGQPSGVCAQGSEWSVNINSFNAPQTNQTVTLYRRASSRFCIASQKIHSREANRIWAWHPDNGFPIRYSNNIIVYIAKTWDGELWAGWFKLSPTVKQQLISSPLKCMTQASPNSGYANLLGKSCYATGLLTKPFVFNVSDNNAALLPEETEMLQLDEDVSVTLEEQPASVTPEVKERIQKYRKRNKTLCDNLKKLYNGTCQITGNTYSFLKKDGSYYTEVHHLIPLGENGSDSYWNTIVVCPMIHRMLHCADVGPIDLSQMVDNKLPITINGVSYTIKWKPEHAQKVKESLDAR